MKALLTLLALVAVLPAKVQAINIAAGDEPSTPAPDKPITIPAKPKAETTDICDRTPQVRDAILAKVSSTNCAAVNLASVTGTLDLVNNQLTTLPAGVFDGLSSLQGLWLNHNGLTTLPEGLFDGLSGLEVLNLDNNQLTTLPEGLFVDLTNLWELSLSNNQLTTLPAGVFDGFSSLWYLRLGGNGLTTLPEGLFDGLSGLRTLDLDNNQLATLPAGVFDGLSSLEELWLEDNHLVGLTKDDPVFDGLTATIELGGQREPPNTQ